jgi:predicted transglutaminase-like cysteine proteinase
MFPMKQNIPMTNVAGLLTTALVAIALAGPTTASAAKAKCGNDPEFKAAWKALQAKERNPRAIRTASRSLNHASTPLPVEAIGNRPSDVCTAVRNRMRYTSDIGDTWQSASESWKRRKGDCEDFAVAVRDLCRAKKMAADVHVFYSKTSRAGHAVTIGRSPDGLWMSSNGSFERITSVADARNTIVRRYGWTGDIIAAYKTSGRSKPCVQTALR